MMKDYHRSLLKKVISNLPTNYHYFGQKGFNLLELLIVTFILGILAAIAVPNLLKQVDKARYTQAIMDMDCIADDVRTYHLENGVFPKDVGSNTKPSGVNCFPRRNIDKIPFNSRYDYESWNGGSQKCYIQITFFGKNGVRNSPTNRVVFSEPGLYYDHDDDLILTLGIFDTPCQ
ncbi:prepilin-type N-terminal cleavage/methylation domain-containing protein [Cyanobacterium aponinum UTEX 3221]|uniref:type II secretion system protein n=1 Tax=Cyanobacterium aponinum TaxID=379064 RepID=UPI002B4BED8E|nr:prepilin-type N-terminal cleavage/methylation domain-containing protein [Cyanobacterium aponinum]WRL37400.1 prepilin-type N-terminal cleavage/methylation domain-containing protein [Cyanobacterium aponinum UTEX 3221]